MPTDEILTDDYVAELLAKDARESSIKYSTIGLEAFSSPSKPPANKPKPNTRFLRNIIKETDSHNAALLAKEAAEARARLRELPKNESPRSKFTGGDIRRRQLGDIAAILGGRPTKRRRTEDSKSNQGRRVNTSSDDEDPVEMPRAERRRANNKDDRKDRDDREDSRRSKSRRQRSRGRSATPDLANQIEDRRRRHKSRSRSPRDRSSKDSKYRHRSPRRRNSRSPETDGRRERSYRSNRKRSPSREVKPARPSKKVEPQIDTKMDDDSDPLDEIIGPGPPPIPEVRTRGRGTVSHASGIDLRFSANYDPTVDVQLDPDEENDWDQALEALRDRQKWKQQGADRLRAAGFTDEEVKKWEKGGEKKEEDVRWAKRGEGREWDRGKVVDKVGDIGVESAFGRLKET